MNNENSRWDERVDERFSVFDLETVALDDAAKYVEPPDYDAIKAPRNYKKAEAIADYIATAKAESQAEYEAKLERCALDFNLARIVAVGVENIGTSKPDSMVCRDEKDEKDALSTFWLQTSGRRLVGFNCRGFDAPMLMQRSRYLGIPYRRLSLARWGKGDTIDLRDEATFDDIRYEALMTRSLEAFCRRIGVHVNDPISGRDIARLVAAGDFESVRLHNLADLERTKRFAEWLGVFSGAGVAA